MKKNIFPDKGIITLQQQKSSAQKSLSGIYMRRFKKHVLGRVGAFILIFLYFLAIFADLISPYTMEWTDKRKSFHPPSSVQFMYKDAKGKTSFKPFCYEMMIKNVAFKYYDIVPEHTIRAISIERLAGFEEIRIIATDDTAAKRKQKIIKGVGNKYGFTEDSGIAGRLGLEIDTMEHSDEKDMVKKILIGTKKYKNFETQLEILLIKGNKNFLGFFYSGVPYKLFNLIPCSIHVFGSRTGGYFIFGADQLGRDIWSRLLHGSRVSLSVGLLGILISFSIGLIVGGIAGYFGGMVDYIIMRACEIILSFPSLILLFALRATFPVNLNSIQVYLLIILIMSLINWAHLARIIRGMVLSQKNEEYVLAARVMGLPDIKIIIKHILRNIVSFIIIQATISIPDYILGESALSFLGLGISEPQASWGLMLAVGRNTRYIKDFPWLLIPGFLIFISIMAWNFLGDGIRDAVDPYTSNSS